MPLPLHRIERTRNKHSRAVLDGEEIVIRLGRNLSRNEEMRHIEYLLRRMALSLARERRKKTIDPFRPLLNGTATSIDVTLTSERSYRFTLVPGVTTRAVRLVDGWKIRVGPRVARKRLHRFLWSLLARAEEASLTRLVHDINAETLRVPVSRVRCTFAATQWGSCSARGVIALNASLLFLPEPLLRYVVIHELAHRIVPSHSARYWRQVERVCPWHREARKALRGYRLSQL